jgi:hypothetical protein
VTSAIGATTGAPFRGPVFDFGCNCYFPGHSVTRTELASMSPASGISQARHRTNVRAGCAPDAALRTLLTRLAVRRFPDSQHDLLPTDRTSLSCDFPADHHGHDLSRSVILLETELGLLAPA